MDAGFDLKTASLEIRKAAKAAGVASGRWEPINHDRHTDVLLDSAVVAMVWNKNKQVNITAGDVRYAGVYL